MWLLCWVIIGKFLSQAAAHIDAMHLFKKNIEWHRNIPERTKKRNESCVRSIVNSVSTNRIECKVWCVSALLSLTLFEYGDP